MTFLLLNLLQPQRRISLVVIIGAVLAFIAGVSLLVYFYRRYKGIEKESEEDWDSSRRSLFVNAPPAGAAKIEETATSTPVELKATVAEEVPVQTSGTRELASNIDLASFAPTTAGPEPQVEAAALEEPIQPEAALTPEPRPTEMLASPSPIEAATETEAEREAAPFDAEVWAGLEIAEQPPFAAEHEVPSQTAPEPLSVARVEQPSQRESFESPRIGRISHREPYEPPGIEPLTPRETAATRELHSAQSPRVEQTGRDNTEEPMARGTVRFGSASEDIPRSAEPRRPERETRELAGELIAATPVIRPEPSIPQAWNAIRLGQADSASPRVQRAGSILGLPAEPSHQPLIFGQPVQPDEDVGIGALTNYGKDVGPKGGRAGTIVLLIVVVLLGSAVGLYFFVPSVHSRVVAMVARLRGNPTQAELDAMKTRAQIIPSSRPEVNKNMVTAKGAVDNISDEPLENLTIEVTLQRGGDAPPETRAIPVTPNPLPPRERGFFEFEYDGKRDTGFAGYTITRLLSNGTPVRFRQPGQK
jgi:hypothetical protein